MNLMLLGAIAMANLTISLFFLRFWKKTGDSFFIFFAISFGLEGFNRILLAIYTDTDENRPFLYLVRLVSFVLILIAIIDKNRINRSNKG